MIILGNAVYHGDPGIVPIEKALDLLTRRPTLLHVREVVKLLCARLEIAEKHIAELQSEIDELNTSAVANDLRWQRQSGRPLEDWEANALKEYEGEEALAQ